MGRARARVILMAYWRRLLRAGGRVPSRGIDRGLPISAAAAPSSQLSIASSTGGLGAIHAFYNVDDCAPFVNVAVQYYFGFIVRSWISEPLGHACRRPLLGVPLCTDVQHLISESRVGRVTLLASATLTGQWLPLVSHVEWQPQITAVGTGDLARFWAARGRIMGQAQAARAMSGYYLQVLQARFKCRVGLHVQCMPQLRRGDAAVVRLLMVRWR